MMICFKIIVLPSRSLNLSSAEIQSTGIQFIPVSHTGNTQSSAEEVEKVDEIINELLNSTVFIDGEERKLVEDDVLIVSPYNSQVYELRKNLEKSLELEQLINSKVKKHLLL